MVFVKLHIPSRRFNDFKILSNIQIIPFETNLRNKKWIVVSIYKALVLDKLLEFCSTWYEKVIIVGDFNIEAENKVMKDFI